ncbi:MAG: DNA cytosine methyltransferase [bacterium]|nr:DNA cytosine methyltransferase [bacterium]
MSYSAVDIFCGIGGLTHGLTRAGIPVNTGIDIDASCQFAYESNNGGDFISRDVRQLAGHQLKSLYPPDHLRILVGCAPCQPFSTHTQKLKHREKDEKWRLLYEFRRLITETQPQIVSMENVPQISRQIVFEDFVNELKASDYHVSWQVVNCPDYGIPQTRKRMVLLASQLGPISLVPPSHAPESHVTVRETIGHLETIGDGDVSTSDSMHRAAALSDTNRLRIRQSKPGGTWRDWDEKLVAPCHRKRSGKSYSSVYSRMEWDKPAPTVTTQFYGFGTGRFGHPEQDRALSYREGALLQTFPEDYKFIPDEVSFNGSQLGIHIGNAVPVRLGEVIGQSIKLHLENHLHD